MNDQICHVLLYIVKLILKSMTPVFSAAMCLLPVLEQKVHMVGNTNTL